MMKNIEVENPGKLPCFKMVTGIADSPNGSHFVTKAHVKMTESHLSHNEATSVKVLD